MTDPNEVVTRLCDAVNEHDLGALATCFATGYRNETPVHPARGFVGRAQVQRNWQLLFGGIPDLRATITDRAVTPDGVFLIHGLGGTQYDLGSMHKRLKNAGFVTHSLTLPGHGTK